jgi:uncharacterized radical SAM superfamily Fe-S cluster-containing enzyme
MKTLGMTQSVCSHCGALVPAKVVTDNGNVAFHKFCSKHGESRTFVRSDVNHYLQAQRYVKQAWKPEAFTGDAKAGCPDGCGFCEQHEQHLCMPIIEITSRCDLTCPVCIVGAGRPWDMTPAEFKLILDGLIHAERQIDVLNLSGVEPLIHPELLTFVDEALARPEVVRVSISTNGLRFLSDRDLLKKLHDRNVVISLQFDGFKEETYEILRGRRLLQEKLRILRMLEEEGISTSLTMTAAGGVNEDQFSGLLTYFFSQSHVLSLMIQPVAFAGRGAGLSENVKRLTIPDITRALSMAGHPAVAQSDFVPLPCSHPLCFSLAFFLMLDQGGIVSISRLTDAATLMDSLSNRVIFGLDSGEYERLKQMIYDLWSGPLGAVPDSMAILTTLRNILKKMSDSRCCSFNAREAFTLVERQVKSIFIHSFQDAETFDLARIRRCCQAYPQPDGKLIPACVQNVLRRNR